MRRVRRALSRDLGHARDGRGRRRPRAQRAIRPRRVATNSPSVARTGTAVRVAHVVLRFQRPSDRCGGGGPGAGRVQRGPVLDAHESCEPRDRRDRVDARNAREPRHGEFRPGSKPNSSGVGGRPPGSVGARAHRHHECVRPGRYLGRAAVGRGSRDDEPVVSTGRDGRRRAIRRNRTRRSRTQSAGNRAQPVEDQRGGSRAASAAHRRGGAALQGPRDERSVARTRNQFLRGGKRRADFESQLTMMTLKTLRTMTRMLTNALVMAAVLGLGAHAQAGQKKTAPDEPRKLFTYAFAGSGGFSADQQERADDLYERARDLIENNRFDRAVAELDRLIPLKSNRTDAALYWKAYSLARLGQRPDALTTVAELIKQYPDSRWLRDARALEVEVRQSSGQTVSPASQEDDELKLYALRGLMNNSPEEALPILEKMLTGTNSPKVKDRALFVLSQSHSPKAREIIANIAKGNGNPDLQMRAIRYLGMMGGADSRALLADVYRATPDPTVKRQILRSYMTSGDRERLFTLAKSETDQSL